MGKKRGRSNREFAPFLWIIVFICFLIAIIPINIAIARTLYPQPQAILCLGGSEEREVFTAQLASDNPQLIVWVSSGRAPQAINQIFLDAGIPPDRYFLDYRARDTVTNFTTLVADFQHHQIKNLYLITSKDHMPRAQAIANIILGSRGIAFTPVSVFPSKERVYGESTGKTLRDIGRSIFWMFSGYTGASLKDSST